jgi:cytochrome c-type biogenesis protein CcmH
VTGTFILLGLALAILLATRFLGRVRGDEAMLVLAALFVAAAGYTWQGRPGLAGASAQGRAAGGLKPDTLYMSERGKLLHVYGASAQWLILADGLNRAGDDLAAAQILAGAVKRTPNDATLRIGYAHALLVVADYNFTPAVALAFDRAKALDPGDPAPRYFEGLARFEAGDVPGATRIWAGLAATLPAGSDWRHVLDQRLAFIALLVKQAGR